MFRRPQASAITVFSAWAAFVMAGLCFYGVLDDNPLTMLARSHLALLAVPPGAGLAVLAYGAVLVAASRCLTCAPTGLLARALVYGFQFVVLAAIVVSTGAAALAVARGGVGQHIFGYTRLPAALTTLAMALALAGIGAWGLLALLIAPGIFLTTPGIFALPTVLAWLGIMAAMALALAAAGAATVGGYRVA
jgi:hypothetical protein